MEKLWLVPPTLMRQNPTRFLDLEDEYEHGFTFQLDKETRNAILMQKLENTPPIISINGPIGERTADQVRKSFSYLDLKNGGKKRNLDKQSETITIVDITSPGGLVSSSFEIMDRFWSSQVYGYFNIGRVTGYGFSGGGCILQSCQQRLMSENAQIMMHFCNSIMFITEHSLEPSRTRRVQEEMRKSNEKLLHFVARRIAFVQKEKTVAELTREMRKLFVKERFLYPDEALRYGLIDKIISNFSDEASAPKEKKTKK